MMMRFVLVSVAAMLWLAPAAAEQGGSAAPVRCGTRWLEEERAAGRLLLPETPPYPRDAAKVAQDTAAIKVGTELQFYVRGSGTLAATCQRVGEHAYVFVENRHWDTNGGSVLQSHVDAIGDLFDASTPIDPERGVYELETEAFGEPADVDGDRRIFILVLDIRFNEDVVGFFDSGLASHAVPEFRRDVVFIDEWYLRRENRLVLGTLAHEFQHLIHWRWDTDEDRWVDEGLSGYAEELVGFPEADPKAVPEFLSRPHTSLTDFNLTDPARS